MADQNKQYLRTYLTQYQYKTSGRREPSEVTETELSRLEDLILDNGSLGSDFSKFGGLDSTQVDTLLDLANQATVKEDISEAMQNVHSIISDWENNPNESTSAESKLQKLSKALGPEDEQPEDLPESVQAQIDNLSLNDKVLIRKIINFMKINQKMKIAFHANIQPFSKVMRYLGSFFHGDFEKQTNIEKYL